MGKIKDRQLSVRERRKQIRYHKSRYEQLLVVDDEIEDSKYTLFKYKVGQPITFKDSGGRMVMGKIEAAQTRRRYKNYYNIISDVYWHYYNIIESRIFPRVVGPYVPGEDEQ